MGVVTLGGISLAVIVQGTVIQWEVFGYLSINVWIPWLRNLNDKVISLYISHFL